MLDQFTISNDSPLSSKDCVEKDLLQFEPSVKTLEKLIGAFKPPFTVGVYGDWGSGKTSYMRMLKNLFGEENYILIWFNAWKYENEESLILPLLSKMSSEANKNQKSRKMLAKVKKIATAVSFIGVDTGLKAITNNNVTVGSIEEALNKAENYFSTSYNKWVNKCDELEEEFKNLINILTNNGERTMVIFVDDLDRCSPENVIKLLESIKNYLSLEGSHCLYVIGVDKNVLVRGIIAKYGEALIDGNDYLEKIVSFSVDIPQPSLGSVHDFVKTTIKKQSNSIFFDEREAEIGLLAKAISRYGITNPRKLKRVLIRLMVFLVSDDYQSYLIEIIVYLVLLREYYPDVHESKKAANRIDYSPSDKGGSTNRSLSFKELEEKDGEGWAKILADKTNSYVKLKDIQNENALLFVSEMCRTTTQESRTHLDSVVFSRQNSLKKTTVLSWYDEGLERSPEKYFEKVDSLFSLV